MNIDQNNKYLTRHPEKQDGLIANLPRGSVPTEYLNQYSIEYEVNCALCARNTPHKNGFTASFPDLGIALIGKDCGRRHFGNHSARTFENNLKRNSDNSIKCMRLLKLAANLREISKVWPSLIAHQKALLEFVTELANCFLDDNIKRHISENGSFTFEDTGFCDITVTHAKCLLSGESRVAQFECASNLSDNFKSINTEEQIFENLEHLLDSEKKFVYALSAGIKFQKSARLFLKDDNINRLNSLAKIYEMGFEELTVERADDHQIEIALQFTTERKVFFIPKFYAKDLFESWVNRSGIRLVLE